MKDFTKVHDVEGVVVMVDGNTTTMNPFAGIVVLITAYTFKTDVDFIVEGDISTPAELIVVASRKR